MKNLMFIREKRALHSDTHSIYIYIYICSYAHTVFSITSRYWSALQPDGRSLAALHHRRAAGSSACRLRGSLRLAPRPQDGGTVFPRIDIGFDV